MSQKRGVQIKIVSLAFEVLISHSKPLWPDAYTIWFFKFYKANMIHRSHLAGVHTVVPGNQTQ